jgi:hypothetical protein
MGIEHSESTTEFLHRLEMVLQHYLHVCLQMVERWFDNLLYGEASRVAASVRSLLGRDPALSQHTGAVLGAYDNLVLALWRSTHVRTKEARLRIQQSMERLFSAVHRVQASATVLAGAAARDPH